MIVMIYFFVYIKHFFNWQEWLQKAKDRYHYGGGKEKAAEYYIANKKVLKENTKNRYITLPDEQKEAKRENGRNRYRNITEDKK